MSNVDDYKKSLSDCNSDCMDFYSEELEKAQYKAKLYKELLDKIDTIKAD